VPNLKLLASAVGEILGGSQNCKIGSRGTKWHKSLHKITAELGRALAVVKVTLQVNGNSQFLKVRPSKTIGAIQIKSGTDDCAGEGKPHAKFGNIPITGGFSPYR